MKKLILLLVLGINQFIFSQITEGYFQYHIDVKAVDPSPKLQQTVAMMQNSIMELYFSKDESRMNFQIGTLNTTSVIINKKTNALLKMNDGVMGKIAIFGTLDELKKPEKDSTVQTVFSDETKKILGYNCNKLTLIDTSLIETEYWYTTEIKISDQINNPTSNPNVPGFPMKFSKTENGIHMVYEISNINETIENRKEIFSLIPPKGYKIVTE